MLFIRRYLINHHQRRHRQRIKPLSRRQHSLHDHPVQQSGTNRRDGMHQHGHHRRQIAHHPEYNNRMKHPPKQQKHSLHRISVKQRVARADTVVAPKRKRKQHAIEGDPELLLCKTHAVVHLRLLELALHIHDIHRLQRDKRDHQKCAQYHPFRGHRRSLCCCVGRRRGRRIDDGLGGIEGGFLRCERRGDGRDADERQPLDARRLLFEPYAANESRAWND
mmetsp:Transcript_64813/g.103127  ORF Transcript_64813/g.103127 Transcript_64813/m.103127 type:complete len:221 (-) Transcript_64813:567-1229(-)